MTVESPTNRSGPFIASGPTGTFPRNFLLIDPSHVRVVRVRDGIEADIATGISHTGLGTASGTVSLSAEIAAGDRITILRAVPNVQRSDYSAQSSVPTDQVERDLDLLSMQMQDLAERQDRTLTLPVDATESGEAAMRAALAAPAYALEAKTAADAVIASIIPSLGDLIASTRSFAVGSILSTRAEGFSFEVVASGGDFQTAGGVRVRRRYRPLQAVATIAQLKALPTSQLASGDLFTVHGFDAAGDGCGGIFRFHSAPAPSATLDGVLMAGNGGGYWLRTDYSGLVHTRWCGIKPEAVPGATYNASGFGASNRTRWQAMAAWCAHELMTFPLLAGKAGIVRGAVHVDAGVHDFIGGNLTLPDCVGLTGTGRGSAVLRANITGGEFLTVGTPGDFTTTSSVESAFADFNRVSVLSHTDVAGGTGILFANAFRATNISHIFARGFGTNLHLDAFGANIANVWLQSGNLHNLRVGPRCNSIDIQATRCDDQRLPSGDNVLIEEAGYARSVRLHRMDIQRSYGRALKFLGVADAAIERCFFEGNNRGDANHPDIWIGGAGVRQFKIDGCYFTGTGRFNTTGSRAINIRDDVTAAARFQITNNQQADSAQGTFEYFIDVDPNVAMEIAAWNNIHTGLNSIPANVVKRGLAAGTW